MTEAAMHLAGLIPGRPLAAADGPRAVGFMAALRAHGVSDHAFGWKQRDAARLWRTHACARVAAE